MFDNITNNLSKVFSALAGKKFISEDDLNLSLREIRVALLEADVALPVVREFINKIKEKAIDEQVIKNVSPAQMIIKIVNDELVEILGSDKSEINFNVKAPLTLMMVGLQGAGKTTSAGKLAYRFLHKNNKKKILLASLDTRRPAAQEQLAILARKVGVDSLEIVSGQDPLEITKRALFQAKEYNYDVLILDTAGRTHIDDELMDELHQVKKIATPHETILVADSLTGQDAINIANSFKEKVGIDGIILTRIDGDNRGGAAITMKVATNCPIKFLGSGEKINELEEFDPKRIASRILGMGDVVSLVEKAQELFDEAEMKKAEKKLKQGNFDLNDLASQLKNMKKMGGISNILGFLPGAGKIKEQLANSGFGEKEMLRQEALILSMTPKERKNPDILNSSRKRRIAAGAGSNIQEVNRLLKKFKQMQKMVKKVGKMDHNSLKNLVGNSDLSAMQNQFGIKK
jgi:signal recognition particle subunit SRP54